jgi:hypothetical protein
LTEVKKYSVLLLEIFPMKPLATQGSRPDCNGDAWKNWAFSLAYGSVIV